jgi:hypothetical protein
MVQPYIGITGLTTAGQVQETCAIWNELEFPGYDLMLGFLLSHGQLGGSSAEPNPRNVGPAELQKLLTLAGEAIAPTFDAAAGICKPLVRAIHYHTKTPAFFHEVRGAVARYQGVDAVQMNIALPSPQEVNKLLRECKGAVPWATISSCTRTPTSTSFCR